MSTIITLLAGCIAGPLTTVPDTSDTSATLDTAAPPLRPIEWRGSSEFGGLGRSLEWLHLDPPLLALGSPAGGMDNESLDLVDLVEPLLQAPEASHHGETRFVHDALDGVYKFGNALLPAGDTTGNGALDFVVFDTRGWDSDVLDTDSSTSAAYLFEGPLDAKGRLGTSDDAVRIFGAPPWRGAPCGDLDGDGDDELCTALGIALGPVADPITFDITWSTAGPAEDVHLVAADLTGTGAVELLVSAPATDTIHRLSGLPAPGDHDLATLAVTTWTATTAPHRLASGGDLDGDGVHDLVVAQGSSVSVSTTLGGDLASAHTTVDLSAADLAIGDFDGDGSDDLAVGGAGAVHLFLGPLTAGTLTAADADNVLVGHHSPDDGFGHALVAADADGDGDDELAVGAPQAPYSPDNESPAGRAYLFHEPATFSWDDYDPPLQPIWPDWVED